MPMLLFGKAQRFEILVFCGSTPRRSRPREDYVRKITALQECPGGQQQSRNESSL